MSAPLAIPALALAFGRLDAEAGAADDALEALAEAVFCACWLRRIGIGDRCIPPFAARVAAHWVGVPRHPKADP